MKLNQQVQQQQLSSLKQLETHQQQQRLDLLG
jgi:hypothetical protein